MTSLLRKRPERFGESVVSCFFMQVSIRNCIVSPVFISLPPGKKTLGFGFHAETDAPLDGPHVKKVWHDGMFLSSGNARDFHSGLQWESVIILPKIQFDRCAGNSRLALCL